MAGHSESKYQRIIIAAVALLALVGLVVVVLDWHEVHKIVDKADWELVPLALLFTAISYACLSYGLGAVFRIFGIRIGQRDLLEIGFVSIVLNHLITIAGLTGLSLRILLMKRRGVETGDILAPSLFHSYFNNLAMLSLLPVGLFHILFSHLLTRGQSVSIGIAAGILALALLSATVLVFIASVRALLLRLAGKLWRFVTRRDIIPILNNFDAALAKGVAAVRRRPLVLALPLGLIVADWVASLVALWFCFDAFGSHIGVGVLIAGFAVGITAGLLSMVPGGLGVQEASMSGIYVLLGVPFEQAILASILFRVVYYFIPFIISLGFYRRLLRETGQAETQGSD